MSAPLHTYPSLKLHPEFFDRLRPGSSGIDIRYGHRDIPAGYFRFETLCRSKWRFAHVSGVRWKKVKDITEHELRLRGQNTPQDVVDGLRPFYTDISLDSEVTVIGYSVPFPWKVYLDDRRETPEGWLRTYTVEGTTSVLLHGRVEELSLDHDLGMGSDGNELPNGYGVLNWIEEQVVVNRFVPPMVMAVHSANASGAERMRRAIEQIRKIHARNVAEQQEADRACTP